VETPVLVPEGAAVLGFYVALVDGGGVEFFFDDEVGLGEAFIDVAENLLEVGGDIARVIALLARLIGAHFVMEDWGVGSHALGGAGHGWEDFVFNVDEGKGLFGDVVVDGGDTHYRLANVEGLVTGEDVVALVAPVGLVRAGLGEVGGGYDGADAFEGLGAGGVDGLDVGVGVGATQDLAVKEVRGLVVCAVARSAGDLVGAVMADRPGADNIEFLVNEYDVGVGALPGCQLLTSCIFCAASITARTILS